MKFFWIEREREKMMQLQRINDERLIFKNMQNIRVVYAIQTLGIIGILAYNYVTQGMEDLRENPLWIISIISTTVLAFLSMKLI